MSEGLGIDSLVKNYGSKRALDGFSAEIREGEVVALIGPNGAGKTTLFRILVKFIKHDRGQVIYWGRVRGREVLNWIRYLPENPSFPEELTVKNLISLHSCVYGEEGGSELSEKFGLNRFFKKTLAELSKGMRRRAFIVASLLGYNKAKLLILDEPFDGLDPEGAIALREFIISQRGKRMVLVSSHALYHLPRIVDRIIFIREGKPVEEIMVENKGAQDIEDIYMRIIKWER